MVKRIIINAVISIAIFLIGIFIYHKNFTLKVYSVDLKGFIAQQKELLKENGKGKETVDRNFIELDKKIREKGDNVVILTSDVVIKGDKIEMD